MITVCICTYNRAARLAEALTALAAQAGVDWTAAEVLVIDNNCTDDTASVVDDVATDLPVRRVVEERQGLSHARNRALVEARGDWIVFTDDDVVVERGWLAEYQAGLRDFPDAGYAAGRVVPDWRGPPPSWFRGEQLAFFDGLLVWCDKGQSNRYLEPHEQGLVGASFAIRMDRVGPDERFRTDLGHLGGEAGAGEETEFILRLQRRGVRGVYIGAASCRHPVDYRRLTFRGLYAHGLVSGRAHRAIVGAGVKGSRLRAALFLARGVLQLIRGRRDRFRQCIINAGVQMACLGR